MASGISYAVLPRDPGHARQIVRTVLRGLPRESIADAELLTSEVVSNAIVHADGALVLAIKLHEDKIRIEVLDQSGTTRLEPQLLEPSRERGRGLAIVEALASSWGVEPRSRGKAVWFELPLGP